MIADFFMFFGEILDIIVIKWGIMGRSPVLRDGGGTEMKLIDKEGLKGLEKTLKRKTYGPYSAEELGSLECFWPPFIFHCAQCDSDYIVERCGKCQSKDEFIIRMQAHIPGAFCRHCDEGFYSWRCEKYGVENTVAGSLCLLE